MLKPELTLMLLKACVHHVMSSPLPAAGLPAIKVTVTHRMSSEVFSQIAAAGGGAKGKGKGKKAGKKGKKVSRP